MTKCALVTGASKGIGRGIALELGKAGYDLAVNYNSDEAGAQEVCEQLRKMGRKVVAIQANISKLEDIDRLFAEYFAAFDRLDVLVNNAGITRMYPFLEITPQQFEELTNTDWRGSFFCAQHAVRHMVEGKHGGVIVNITSNHQMGQWPYASIYGPTKAALNKFTQNLAVEVARKGIRVVSVAPGYTFNGDEKKQSNMRESEAYEHISKRIPVDRFCTPEEVGKAVVYLCSDAAGYITGTCLALDGGALLANVVENALEVQGEYGK